MYETVPPLGLITHAELRAAGCSRTEIDASMRRNALVRVARGWYAMPGHDPTAAHALALGGRLTCLSALDRHGVWVPEDRRTHIRFPAWQALPPLTPLEHGHRLPERVPEPLRSLPIDPVAHAFATACRCLDDEALVVIADSILNTGLMPLSELHRVAGLVSKRALERLDHVDPLSQSGTETLVRLRLRAHNIPVRSQVLVGGDRVDLLIGDRLVIECDSRRHHAGEEEYVSDRARDLRVRLVGRGYLVLRYTYAQIVHEWERVDADIRRHIQRREHLWRGSA